MKYIILVLMLSANSQAYYDAKIKDNKGYTQGYIKAYKGKVILYDRKGYKRATISSDGDIKDRKGYRKGYIKNDK